MKREGDQKSQKVDENFYEWPSVTNDAAERGVKLFSDYANCLTTDSNEREYILQVVQQNRRELPSCSKTAMSKYFDK